MLAKLIYVLVFLLVFVLTTGGLVYLNNKYENIFKFNFAPTNQMQPHVKNQNQIDTNSVKNNKQKDSTMNLNESEVKDSVLTKKPVTVLELEKQIDSLKNAHQALMDISNRKLAEKEKEIQSIKTVEKARSDSAYMKWKEQMVKIYETMDAKSAAKLIEKLADNLARDILFSLKNKKAAQIIKELNPETANRLTGIQ
ncbi:MAG: hypothetical protein WCJ01_04690 [Ignavibacteria bacterium]